VSAAPPRLFPIRLAAAWLAAAALACAGSLYLMTRDSGSPDTEQRARPTIYSTSAIGYAALYHTLQRLGVPAGEGRAQSASQNGAAVVVIAEPDGDPRTRAHVRAALRDLPALLLALPKRRGVTVARDPDRLIDDELVPAADVESVLGLADPGATLVRGSVARSWNAQPPLPASAPAVHDVQLIRSRSMRALLSSENGILVGEIDRDQHRLIVVSDPDILENHGLARGDNALVAVTLVRSLRAGRPGRVVFDEAAHGFVSRPFGALGLLFGFPFVLVTLQIVVAGGLAMWSGSGRFGAPRARAPALGAGKQSLIESGARLVESAGALVSLARRYREAVLRDAAQRLHAPRGLSPPELLAWLDRTGRSAPPASAAPALDAEAAVADARAVYRWRNDVLDES
jgi:hypothetical protein